MNIDYKIDLLKRVTCKIDNSAELEKKLRDIALDYAVLVCDLKKDDHEIIRMRLQRCDIKKKLDEIHSVLLENDNCVKILKKYNKNNIVHTPKNHRCDECKLDLKMDLLNNSYYCEFCGLVLDVGNMELKAKKTGVIAKQKHFKTYLDEFYLDHTKKIRRIDIENIKKHITGFPTNNNVKKALHTIKRKDLLSHIPYIITKIKGDDNVFIDKKTYDEAFQLFKDVIKIKSEKKMNLPNYRYLLYKIIDIILDHDPVTKKIILEKIVMQRTCTILANDLKWKQICLKLNLEYRPTVIVD